MQIEKGKGVVLIVLKIFNILGFNFLSSYGEKMIDLTEIDETSATTLLGIWLCYLSRSQQLLLACCAFECYPIVEDIHATKNS